MALFDTRPKRRVNVFLSQEQIEELRDIADATGAKFAQVLRFALDRGIESVRRSMREAERAS